MHVPSEWTRLEWCALLTPCTHCGCHRYKWHGRLPQQLPREVVALGGVIAVHLWTTVSPISPARRIECARMMGFWSMPSGAAANRPRARVTASASAQGGSGGGRRRSAGRAVEGGAARHSVERAAEEGLRASPLLLEKERALPSSTLFYREALVEALARLRSAHEEALTRLGFDAERAERAGFPRFPRFAPVQRHGIGRWPDGRAFAPGEPRSGMADSMNYSSPGGKCAVGMSTFWPEELDVDV